MSLGKYCPRCGKVMVERQNRRTDQPFWGCSQFPKCKGSVAFTTDWDNRDGHDGVSLVNDDYPGEDDWDDEWYYEQYFEEV